MTRDRIFLGILLFFSPYPTALKPFSVSKFYTNLSPTNVGGYSV